MGVARVYFCDSSLIFIVIFIVRMKRRIRNIVITFFVVLVIDELANLIFGKTRVSDLVESIFEAVIFAVILELILFPVLKGISVLGNDRGRNGSAKD